ncbi:MAG: hypothetical protein HYR85_17505 [Planctomycetes bacterium]|nr:hypothetical protein [Planctomycetota bacterium]MBI3848062.1 hypothetical protein [Planctomycetota bacterium]
MDRTRIVRLRIVPPEVLDDDAPSPLPVHRCAVAVVRDGAGALRDALDREARSAGVEARVRETSDGAVLVVAWHRVKPASRLVDSVILERTLAAHAPPARGDRARKPPKEHRLLYRALKGDLQNAALVRGLLRAACARTGDPTLALVLWRAWLDAMHADAFLRERLEALGGSPDPDLAGAHGYGTIYGAVVTRIGPRVLRLATRGVANLAADNYAIRAEIYRERSEHRSARRFDEFAESARRLATEI